MKSKIKRSYLIFLLVCTFSVSCLAKYGGGSGTDSDPYLIYTAEQLNDIGKTVNVDDLDGHFALMADIDLSAYTGNQFRVIGKFDEPSDVPFSGVFDGRGHVISNFTYVTEFFDVAGLFGQIYGENAVVKNLGIKNPDVVGDVEAGCLAAVLENGIIENCWAQDGSAETLYLGSCGGLVGSVFGGRILNCYTKDVTVTSFYQNFGAGGLLGENNEGVIVNSFSACTVDSVSGYEGALVGLDSYGEYYGCFWDSTVGGSITGIGNITDPPEVFGQTTANMKKSSTFINAGWDIVTMAYQDKAFIWRMCVDDVNYPKLNIENEKSDFVCPDGVDIYDLASLAEEWQNEKFEIDIDFYYDRQIDFLDWARLASAWQSTTGQPNYDEKYDIAPAAADGVIDEKDIAVFTEYWLAKGAVYLNTDISPVATDDIVNFYDYAELSNNWQDN